jgi:hypothetical protein
MSKHYWVKPTPDSDWEIGELFDSGQWWFMACPYAVNDGIEGHKQWDLTKMVIGPKIEPPEPQKADSLDKYGPFKIEIEPDRMTITALNHPVTQCLQQLEADSA